MAVPTRLDGSVLLALFAAWAVSCNGAKKPVPDASPSASTASVAVADAGAPDASAPPGPPVVCRAMQVAGKAGFRHGRRIAKGAVLDGKRWLQLEEGAVIALRHATSTRELTLKGPGLMLPCLDGDEDVLVARGVVETSTGAGVRPGAEVRVATPFGTMSYGDAAVIVNVEEAKLTLAIHGGQATFTPKRPSTGKEPRTLDQRNAKITAGGKLTLELVKTRVGDCEKAAEKAEAQAIQVISPTGDAGVLGDRAAEHVRLRGSARLDCLSARAAVVSLGDEGVQKDLEKRLDEADRRRTRVPTR